MSALWMLENTEDAVCRCQQRIVLVTANLLVLKPQSATPKGRTCFVARALQRNIDAVAGAALRWALKAEGQREDPCSARALPR